MKKNKNAPDQGHEFPLCSFAHHPLSFFQIQTHSFTLQKQQATQGINSKCSRFTGAGRNSTATCLQKICLNTGQPSICYQATTQGSRSMRKLATKRTRKNKTRKRRRKQAPCKQPKMRSLDCLQGVVNTDAHNAWPSTAQDLCLHLFIAQM